MKRAIAVLVVALVALSGCDSDGTLTYEKRCRAQGGTVNRLPDTLLLISNGHGITPVTQEHFTCTLAGRVVSRHNT